MIQFNSSTGTRNNANTTTSVTLVSSIPEPNNALAIVLVALVSVKTMGRNKTAKLLKHVLGPNEVIIHSKPISSEMEKCNSAVLSENKLSCS